MGILEIIDTLQISYDPIVLQESVNIVRDHVEFHSLSRNDAVPVIQALIRRLSEQKDKSLRDDILDAISGIAAEHQGLKVNWEQFANQIPGMDNNELEYALTALGNSLDERYLPLLTEYQSHADEFVMTAATQGKETLIYSKRSGK